MESDERPLKIRKLDHEREALTANGNEDLNQKEVNEEPKSNEICSLVQNENPIVVTETPTGDTADPQENAPAEGGSTFNDVAPSVDSAAVDNSTTLSKSQQKKLRKKAEWESKRDDRKIMRKEKLAAKRERKKVEKAEQLEKQRLDPSTSLHPNPKPVFPKAVQLPITFIIDCDFDDLMHDGERTSLGSQITRCYSDNSKSPFRAHLALSSFGGKLRERFDGLLNSNYKAWRGFRALDEDFLDVAGQAQQWMLETGPPPTSQGAKPKSKGPGRFGGELGGAFAKYAELEKSAREELRGQGETVYLSSEGETDLTELKPYSTYIIGGLVDKNREKGICHKRATQRGVRTARLPIGQFMEMTSRKVLATNHVNEIMLRWLESGDWGDAFLKCIPKRKGGKLKGAEKEEEEGERNGSAMGEDEDEGDEEDEGEELAEHGSFENGNNAAKEEETMLETKES